MEFTDTKKYQSRIHKKKRINKKWMKRYGFYNLRYKADVSPTNNNSFILNNTKVIKKVKCD